MTHVFPVPKYDERSKRQRKASTYILLEGTSTLKDTLGVENKFSPNIWKERKGKIPAREVS